MAINTIGNSGAQNAAPLPAAPQGAPAAAPPAPAVVAKPAPQPSPEQVRKAVESMKQMIEVSRPNSLQFSIDEDTGKTLVRVSDAQTGEMIRQIPSEELLEIARSLDKMQGLLLRNKA